MRHRAHPSHRSEEWGTHFVGCLRVIERLGHPPGPPAKWKFGSNKSEQQWRSNLARRGWTPEQIDEAVANGQKFPAQNNINPSNGATRYVNPTTGRSVVLDNVTNEVIHVGGDGFRY
jgi:hypothetical protein